MTLTHLLLPECYRRDFFSLARWQSCNDSTFCKYSGLKNYALCLTLQIQNANDVLIAPLEKFRKEQIGAAKVSGCGNNSLSFHVYLSLSVCFEGWTENRHLYSNILDATLVNVLVNYTEFFASEKEMI